MKLSEIKTYLSEVDEVNFRMPDGEYVPKHFHVTEVGEVRKNYIDCGGTIRIENKISIQLWKADDYDHRLQPKKFLDIIKLSENVLQVGDYEVEVEYQGATIGKYNLGFDGKDFWLLPTTTACLAPDKCGIPQSDKKEKVQLSSITKSAEESCCTPGGGCC